ncbi:MAG: RNA 3'-terminal phosphate cyclase [Anaerolineae bacterium]|nr:RNA 3'-terminal phosphate cyclase [Anaerolineae bacterium]
MIHVDGSYGEGGGQILRTSLSLSAITGQPLCIERIRAGRRQPGLRPQHLTAVRAAATICGARLQGDTVGSPTLVFEPQHRPQAGRYEFDVRQAAQGGSAGSVTLIFQTLLLPLALAEGSSELILHGGTHGAWSPPFHYLQHVYLPMVARLGIRASVELRRWGWYPQGNGEIKATVRGHGSGDRGYGPGDWRWSPDPSPLTPMTLVERGALKRLWGLSATSNLPTHVRERMRKRALERLLPAGVRAEIELVDAPSPGPGAGLFLFAEYEGVASELVTAGFSGFGRQGKPAEAVADEAVEAFLAYHQSGAPVDPHLADQLILPLALSGGAAIFRTSEVTRHLLTSVWVVGQFLDVEVRVEGEMGQAGLVRFSAG